MTNNKKYNFKQEGCNLKLGYVVAVIGLFIIVSSILVVTENVR